MIATVIILATNAGLIMPLKLQSSLVYHRHGLQQQPVILQMQLIGMLHVCVASFCYFQ